jgi:D-inositol-3-phosphate glycosyltransferase
MERHIALISEHASPATALGSEDAGGQNVYVAEVSHHLADHGFLVDIFTRADDPALPPMQPWAPGVRLMYLRAGPVRKLPKDHLWGHMPAFRDALVQFATQESSVYDVIYSHFWMSGWVATQLKPLLEAPTVAIMHATGMTKRRFQGAADTSPAARIAVERAMMQQVDALIVQCPAERDEFIHDYGVAPETIHLIPAGVDTAAFHPIMKRAARRQIGLVAEGPVVVYVGRILPRKDISTIVRAIARVNATGDLAPITLLVVGGASDPATRAETCAITHLADTLGVRLHCAGQQPQSVLNAIYCAGDVTVTTP